MCIADLKTMHIPNFVKIAYENFKTEHREGWRGEDLFCYPPPPQLNLWTIFIYSINVLFYFLNR